MDRLTNEQIKNNCDAIVFQNENHYHNGHLVDLEWAISCAERVLKELQQRKLES